MGFDLNYCCFHLFPKLSVYKEKTKYSLFGFAVAMAFVGIGILTMTMAQPQNHPYHYTKHLSDGKFYWHFKIKEVLKPNLYSHRYIAQLIARDSLQISGKLLLSQSINAGNMPFNIDDEGLYWGSLLEIRAPLNPHQFNYQKYMNGLGIYHQIRLDSSNSLLKTKRSRTFRGTAAAIRSGIVSKLKKANFKPDERSIIQALLLGERNDISTKIYTDYKNAGAIHILAVSGLHIGILLVLLQFVLKPIEFLPRGRQIKLALIVLCLWGFAFIAGLSASIVRAVTMFSFVAYALYLNRPSNTFNVLALSMFFILLVFNPMLLFHVGFQMSYAAVFAIVALYPRMMRFWFPKNQLIRKLWQLLSVSFAAQLGVLPISLYYFHQFPGLFFVSNLVIVPFLGFILGTGILIIVLALLDVLPDALVTFYSVIIKVMNQIIGWVGGQDAFVFKNLSFDELQLVFSYLTIFSLLSVLKS